METLTQTRTNVETIQQAFADFAAGNIQGILDVCTNDVVWTGAENPTVPMAGTFKGKEGVMDFFSKLAENVEFSSFEPKEFFSDKNAVIVLGTEATKVKKNGKAFQDNWCMIFRMRDGKMYHYEVFGDTRKQAESFM